MAFVAPGVSGGRTFQAAAPPAGRPAVPRLENASQFLAKGSSLSIGLCAVVLASQVQRSGILRRSRAKTSRKSTASGTTGSCCRKSQCLHPDKPAMFACADCPRRTSKSASEEGLDSQPVAVTNLRCLHAQTALAWQHSLVRKLPPRHVAGSRSACTQTNLRCLHAQTALAA
ncbi:unnamed protein product [Durusdinium trenchii]|uniref:Uncharacterized protein n=1 Tax=Durusdinium trenchii TaxID=1381693 RepID=A0ABP0MTZ3_9DINO